MRLLMPSEFLLVQIIEHIRISKLQCDTWTISTLVLA